MIAKPGKRSFSNYKSAALPTELCRHLRGKIDAVSGVQNNNLIRVDCLCDAKRARSFLFISSLEAGKASRSPCLRVLAPLPPKFTSLKSRSKDYREMMIDFIRRSWPALMETDVRKVTERDCENWHMRYQLQYAPTVVNNSIGTLRAVSDEAISTGARFNNPAADLSRVKVRSKRLELPSRDQFLRFVEEIRTAGAR